MYHQIKLSVFLLPPLFTLYTNAPPGLLYYVIVFCAESVMHNDEGQLNRMIFKKYVLLKIADHCKMHKHNHITL